MKGNDQSPEHNIMRSWLFEIESKNSKLSFTDVLKTAFCGIAALMILSTILIALLIILICSLEADLKSVLSIGATIFGTVVTVYKIQQKKKQ